jgi:hypothetical protein
VTTPAPAGSTLPALRVDVDGDWFDGDVPITHPGLVANLRANLRRDGDGYFIQTRVRIPVTVEDVPFVIERLTAAADGFRVVLNDGTEALVDPATVRIGAGEVPYCEVKEGRFEARLSRAAAYQLLSLARLDPDTGEEVLPLGEHEYRLRRRTRSP